MTPSSLILLILALLGSPIRGEAPPFKVNKLKEWTGGIKGGGTGDSGGWEGFVAGEGRDSSRVVIGGLLSILLTLWVLSQ